MDLEALARACREESTRYARREASSDEYCFELFRRSIADGSDVAWAALVTQYRSLVLTWIRRHPVYTALSENDEYWVNRAFERFWRAIPAERFARFATVADLLTYLKTCAHCVLLDEARGRQIRAESLDDLRENDDQDTPRVEEDRLGALTGRELWGVILREAKDDAERQVMRLSFALDLKPNEIQSRHPELYPSVADVYRVKRNVIERLRRSPDVLAYLQAGI